MRWAAVEGNKLKIVLVYFCTSLIRCWRIFIFSFLSFLATNRQHFYLRNGLFLCTLHIWLFHNGKLRLVVVIYLVVSYRIAAKYEIIRNI